MIWIDNISTYPSLLREIALKVKTEGLYHVYADSIELEYVDEIIKTFYDELLSEKIVLYHASRVLDKDTFYKKGILNGKNILYDNLNYLINYCKFTEGEVSEISKNAKKYYERDACRNHGISFFSSKKYWDENDEIKAFCETIGGEIMQISISGLNDEIRRRFKNIGNPVVVKFWIEMAEIQEYYAYRIIREFIKYYLAKEEQLDYKIMFDGDTRDNVSSNQVLDVIDIIKTRW